MSLRSPSILRISSNSSNGVSILELDGELDFGVVDQLATAYADVRATGTNSIVVDLSKLRFADCSAVRLLMQLAEKSQNNGHELKLRPGPARVQRVFELTGTADSLPFEV